MELPTPNPLEDIRHRHVWVTLDGQLALCHQARRFSPAGADLPDAALALPLGGGDSPRALAASVRERNFLPPGLK